MGYVRGFVHGTVAGVAVGLVIAPQTGEKTRAQLAGAARAVREGAEVTTRALQRVAPVATNAVHAVERVRHRREEAPAGNGTVRITEA